jgi:hypothetical protein
MGLSFTIAAGPRQRSHSHIRVPRDSSHFTVSDSRLPQPGGPCPRFYIPHEQDGPVPRYIGSGRTHGKHRFLYFCLLIHYCRDMFTAQFRSNERVSDPQRTPLATPLVLLHDIAAYAKRFSAACVRAIT